jgi:peptidoglycan/xylan/chitin deacetylase (PgdA/CDA1 family)
LYTHEPTSRWKEIGKKCLQALPPSLLFFRGPQSGRQLALTFDDGPDPQYTPRILEALRKHGAKATFFLIGERAEQEPALVRQILADGHELANHSHSHPDFERLPLRRAMQEISRTTAMIEAIQGSRCRLFRPPKGKLCLNSLIPAWTSGRRLRLRSPRLSPQMISAPEM